MDTTTAGVTTATFKDDMKLFRYKTCNNMSADVTSYLPLCANQTVLVDYNGTDDEIEQVNKSGPSRQSSRAHTFKPKKTLDFLRT